MDQQRSQGDERRIIVILPVANLLFIKPGVVLTARVAQRVMIRVISLNQNFAGQITASGSTSDLGQQLEGPLGGAEIGQRQTGVDRYHTNQRNIWEIVTFGEYLGADQHI